MHNDFYNSQRFTLNITRQDMVKMGYSPSVRLFEAGACGIPVISDYWEGLETIFTPGREIFISGSADDTIRLLLKTSESQIKDVGERARAAVLRKHTGEQRAIEFEQYFSERVNTLKGNRPDFFTDYGWRTPRPGQETSR
jgi:spore maturation protein CgeB